VKAGIDRALAAYPRIESLSIDTWGCDYVLLEGERELWPCYSYRDHRTEAIHEEAHAAVPFPELYRRTGCQFQPPVLPGPPGIPHKEASAPEGALQPVILHFRENTERSRNPPYIIMRIHGIGPDKEALEPLVHVVPRLGRNNKVTPMGFIRYQQVAMGTNPHRSATNH
jgi:hypothetical protein